MLIIKVQDGENIDRALKRYKQKTRRTKLINKLRDQKQFIKKSVKNRRKIGKAIYVQNLRVQEEN
ncbi:MAG: 30S ribosomal protein S21 [Lutibacter sp.]|nr:30S ribosomal protein S21 [Lutibacter sp.]